MMHLKTFGFAKNIIIHQFFSPKFHLIMTINSTFRFFLIARVLQWKHLLWVLCFYIGSNYPSLQAQSFTENFDDITLLPGNGWALVNASSPIGITGWFQGNNTVFSAFNGATDSYIGANFNNTTGANTISNWLMSPMRTFNNGDVISFYTRTVDVPAFPDRLRLMLSTNGVSTAPADFTVTLLSVNNGLTTSGYPNSWTQFSATLSGLPPGGASGRFALKYDVTNGGPTGANSDYIGIDNVVYTAATCPSFSGAPANVGIVNSTCNSNVVSGGSITAPTGTPCPAGSTLQYNVNNSGWTSTLPVYAQTGPTQSIVTRCACDSDGTMVSAESTAVTTAPGVCSPPSPCDVITPLPCGTAVSPSLSGTGFWNTSFCGNSTVGSEAVYSFTPTMSGVHTLIINGVGGDPVDFGYKLASDGCSSSGWNCIGTSTGTSYYTFGPLTAGVQYYILLDAHTTAFSAQNFEINCNIVPANDLCVNAITIPAVTGNICGTTLGANPDIPNSGATCGTSADGFGAGVWYTFQGNGQDWSFFFPQQGSSWDPEVNVYSGSCGSLTCVTGDDDSGGGLNAQFTVSNTMAGTTYYVYVHPADDFGNGTSDFCFTVTTTLPPCPTFSGAPANVGIVNSTCGSGCTLTGGSITAPTGTPCPAGSTLQYNVNNSGWTTSLPVYDQDGPAQTIRTRCACDNDANNVSAESNPVSTVPGTLANPVVPANGSAIVACPALATQPTPPTVMACDGSPITPSGPVISNSPNPVTCEGTRTYTWTYSCGSTSSTWSFVYTIERNPFTVPANGAATVACLAAITVPVPPAVNSNCGEPIAPAFVSIVDSPTPLTCEGTRTYNYSYTDCEGNTLLWSFVYTIERNPFTVPANGAATVNSLTLATQPTPPTVTSNCGEVLTPTGPVVTNVPDPIVCTGTRTYAWTYTDCEGNTAVWSFVYTIIDNTPPMATCHNQTIAFNGQESITLNASDLVTVSDNCGPPSITLSPSFITCQQVGQIVPVTITVKDASNNTVTCTANVTVGGLPCGWSQQANGVNCANGNSIAYNAATGVYTATSTNCFYGPPFTGDATAFAQRTLCGNGSITALVTGINPLAGGWAGIVMRENNTAGAKKAQLMTNLGSDHRREFRIATNGSAQMQQFPSQNRYWLRITRVGNQFTMFVSSNGVNWFPAGAQNIVMPSCIQMGLVATNYTANSTVTATFSNVSFTGSNSGLGSPFTPDVLTPLHSPLTPEFDVYPNPTGGDLNVDLAQYVGRAVRLEVYSLEGKLLQFSELDEVQNTLERLDLKGLQNGMYLVKVKSAGLPDATRRVVLTRG